MKWADLNSDDHAYLQLEEIAEDQFRILWINDWWDGPLEGVVQYQSKEHLFKLITDEPDDGASFYRRFVLIALTDEQITDERHWHDLFVEKVGSHWTYDEHGKPMLSGAVKPKKNHHEFYEAYKKRIEPDYAANNVVGWFEIK